MVPSEVSKIAADGEFGKELTVLNLTVAGAKVGTLRDLILSLPKLREFVVDRVLGDDYPMRQQGLPDETWQWEPLHSLALLNLPWRCFEAIALCGITSRRINLSITDKRTMEKVIACSSEVVKEVVIRDMHFSSRAGFTPANNLPPLPALATIEIEVCLETLSPSIADFVRCIQSAQSLSLVTFKYIGSTPAMDTHNSSSWFKVDEWLAMLATSLKKNGNLTVVLTPWPERNSKWEEYLPEFRKAGGELKVR